MTELERIESVPGQLPLPGLPEDALFPVEPAEKLSAGRRLTARQRADVARGVHPLRRDKARPDLGTCGTCRFREVLGWHDRSFPKCAKGPRTHGAGTDVRAWWPACDRYERKAGPVGVITKQPREGYL